jgi:Domain of unknown function (DUF1929)
MFLFGQSFLLSLLCSGITADLITQRGGLRKLQNADTPLHPVKVDNGSVDPLLQGLIIPANAADVGMWSPMKDWPIVGIHTAVLPDGRIVSYGSPPGGQNIQQGRVFVLWDPMLGFDGSSTMITSNPEFVDSFCSAATILPDGTLLMSGGSSGPQSTRKSSKLDYKGAVATRAEDLTYPRWYGTMTALPDGTALATGGCAPYIVGGWQDPVGAENKVSSTPEIYTRGKGWEPLNTAHSLDAFGAENNRYWYPRQWVTPFGTVFGISTDKMWELKVSGGGSIKTIGTFKTKPNDTTLPNVGPTSTAVMFDTGKILQVGGNGYANGYASQSSNQATIFDVNKIDIGRVDVVDTASMNFPRQWAQSTVLPTGTVLVTGGTRFADEAGGNAVLQSEIWNPATGKWTVGPSASVYRGYHSSGALLPNGVVLTLGGGIPGPIDNRNAEFFYPPYLFQKQNGVSILATQPKIISMSTNALTFNAKLQIQLKQGESIREISLISLPIATHSFDSNQRRMRLGFEATPTGITATMPLNANLAPPGYYYLSVINVLGVPSKAVIISLDAAAPPLPRNPIETVIGEITGAFEITLSGRYDNVNGYFWQRLFDFGNGPGKDNIWFGQVGNTNDMCFEIWKDGKAVKLVSPGSIVNGETAVWKTGVDTTGMMWIEKNGKRLAEQPGVIPTNVIRVNKFIGKSNWPADPPLVGAVSNFQLTLKGSPSNTVSEIKGAFEIRLSGRFDNVNGFHWQRLFDFGNGPEKDNVWLGQLGNTNDMCFEIWKDGKLIRLVAPGAIINGEAASWKTGVDTNGLMWIEKNGKRLAEQPGVIPTNVIRINKFIGKSNWPADSPLQGVVSGLQVINKNSGDDILSEITGAFEVSLSGRYDNPNGLFWQRLFDFGNGPEKDNVWLGQIGNTNDMCMEVWKDGKGIKVVAPGAIVKGETAAWKAGVDANGLMWIEKNGNRLVQQAGAVPANVIRVNKFIGKSNWVADSPLQGAVSSFQIINKDSTVSATSEITGAFEVSLSGRYDNPNGLFWQKLFDFGNGPGDNNVWLGQFSNSNDMCFEVWKDGTATRIIAPGTIIKGETANWKVGVDVNGLMWIEKNGNQLVQQAGAVPANVIRVNKFIGKSNWIADSPLQGVVTNFQLTNKNSVLTALPEITGAFEVSLTGRYDNISGSSWQKLFDFSNGPEKDNVWLGQVGNSNDMCLEVWKDGKAIRLVAPGAIISGETSSWKAGVDTNGLMWIGKNGQILAQQAGVIPANVVRVNKFIAKSNWPGDGPLQGAVVNFQLTNKISVQSGSDVVSELKFSEITGPFKATMIARFDSIKIYAWQRIFDFGNGPEKDNVWFGQVGSSNDVCLEVWRDGKFSRLTAPGALVDGQTATWKVGVDGNGLMWIEKDSIRLSQMVGLIPANIVRTNKFIGTSNWPGDAPLKGAVLGIDIVNTNESSLGVLLNHPAQITGAFKIQVFARFDELSERAWQRVFDFGNGPQNNCILLGQCGNSSDMCFHIWKAGVLYSIQALQALKVNEMAAWSVGVDTTGLMWISKNGRRIAEGQGTVPANVQRHNNFIGESNLPSDMKIRGVVAGLKVI